MLPKTLVAASLHPIMLSILAQGEAYGYQIIQRVHRLSGGKIQWTAGTLYPVLHRLETKGLITSFWRVADSGRRRKYYRITPDGLKALEIEQTHWLDVHRLLLELWDPLEGFRVSGSES
jgi:DNA-binding PadR family transcriptional regulator